MRSLEGSVVDLVVLLIHLTIALTSTVGYAALIQMTVATPEGKSRIE